MSTCTVPAYKERMAQRAHTYLTDCKRRQTTQGSVALLCPRAGLAGPDEREAQAQLTDLPYCSWGLRFKHGP